MKFERHLLLTLREELSKPNRSQTLAAMKLELFQP